MAVIPFGEWLPDHAPLGNPGVVTATNVFPSASGYRPVPSLEPVTSALEDRPRGAIRGRDSAGNAFEYAGDAGKLYRNVGGTWTDASRVGGYATADEERWEFVQWKNKILAVNFSDNPQQITFGDTNFSDLTSDFRARHIAVVRDFVVAANTFDAVDDLVPSRVRWSAFNNETDWTVSPATLADYQDLKVAAVERIFGGEFGVVFQRNSVWRQSFVGAPVVFQFDEVLPGVGLIAPGAAVRDGDTIYFLSDRGFLALVNGTQAVPIGANKVDEFIRRDLNESFLARISAVAEPGGHRIWWAYPSVQSAEGIPDRILVYDKSLGRWSLIEQEVELLWVGGGTGLTLEDLDDISPSIDDLPASLDSKLWIGAAAQLSAFNGDRRSGSFTGPNMEAVIETKEIEINAGRRTQLNAFRPLIDGGNPTAVVGWRNRQSDPVSFGPPLTQRASGRYTFRKNARYHRFRFRLSGDWQHAIGFQILPEEARRSARRG